MVRARPNRACGDYAECDSKGRISARIRKRTDRARGTRRIGVTGRNSHCLAKVETESNGHSDTDANSDPKIDANAVTDTDHKSDTRRDAYSDRHNSCNPYGTSDAEYLFPAGSGSNGNADSNSNRNSKANAHEHADCDGNSNRETNTDRSAPFRDSDKIDIPDTAAIVRASVGSSVGFIESFFLVA